MKVMPRGTNAPTDCPAEHLVHGPEAHARHVLANLLRDVAEEGLHELRRAVEALAELGVLRGDSDRAGIEMADPHHDAAHDDERSRGEPELLGPEQGGDDDVAARFHLTIDLNDDPIT